MRVLKWIGLLVVVAAVVVVGLGLSLPAGYAVERSRVIEASRERIHALVGDLGQWPVWTPWQAEDPTIVIQPGERQTGVGASQSWTGDSGNGAIAFTRSDPERGIVYDLSFDDGAWVSVGALRYEPLGDDGRVTRVVWTMAGDNTSSLFGRYFGLFIDEMVGPMFERGLAKLEAAAETGG